MNRSPDPQGNSFIANKWRYMLRFQFLFEEFRQQERPHGFRRTQGGPKVFKETGYFESSVLCECMVNQAKKIRSFASNQKGRKMCTKTI